MSDHLYTTNTQQIMSRPPPRRGPNPFLLLGLVVLGTASFFWVLESKKDKPLGRRMAQNLLLPIQYKDEVVEPERPKVAKKLESSVEDTTITTERRV
jgi:hypothetical protein